MKGTKKTNKISYILLTYNKLNNYMAIEDEIINIADIDVGTEILKSDRLLIETNNGTKLIKFKDFVVGPDNISSVRQSQIESNVAAIIRLNIFFTSLVRLT